MCNLKISKKREINYEEIIQINIGGGKSPVVIT